MAARTALPLSSADNNYDSASYVASLMGETRRILKEPTAANWADEAVRRALRDEYAELWALIGLLDSRRRASAPTTMTYTSGQTRVTLPTALQNRPIISVEDITASADAPIPLDYVPWDDLFTVSGTSFRYILNQTFVGNRKYSLLGNQISIFPAPAGDLSLSLVVSPVVDDMASANHEVELEFEPLLYYGAALRLLEVDAEDTPALHERYQRLRDLFVKTTKRWVRHRPRRIRRIRGYF